MIYPEQLGWAAIIIGLPLIAAFGGLAAWALWRWGMRRPGYPPEWLVCVFFAVALLAGLRCMSLVTG